MARPYSGQTQDTAREAQGPAQGDCRGAEERALLHDDANLADVVRPAQSVNDLLGRVNT